jgi:hypothetical protein
MIHSMVSNACINGVIGETRSGLLASHQEDPTSHRRDSYIAHRTDPVAALGIIQVRWCQSPFSSPLIKGEVA